MTPRIEETDPSERDDSETNDLDTALGLAPPAVIEKPVDPPRDPRQDPAIGDIIHVNLDDGSTERREVYMTMRVTGGLRITYWLGKRESSHTCSLASWREIADVSEVLFTNPDVK